LREVEKCPSIVGFEPGTLALIANVLTNFAERTDNDLVRDLSLTKTSFELLASRLKENNLLGEDARITFCRRRHEDYMGYFCQEEDFMYCRDVSSLLDKICAPQYDPRD